MIQIKYEPKEEELPWAVYEDGEVIARLRTYELAMDLVTDSGKEIERSVYARGYRHGRREALHEMQTLREAEAFD